VFSVFFTAGFPRLADTRVILSELQRNGVDMVEIGFPFSDPIADGPTIQQSSYRAIENGMTVAKLFEQLTDIRKEITMPIVLMGYANPMLQYGEEAFLRDCARCGVDALFVPDLPFEEYRAKYATLFEKHAVAPIFFVTTRTPEARIRQIDAEQPAFLYVVSSEAVTGGTAEVTVERDAFFSRLAQMNLKSPLIVGFGVADKVGFQGVTKHTQGAIVGSAFVRAVCDAKPGASGHESDPADLAHRIREFREQFR
jgi:tryptophan synthase alpha chain